MNDFLSALRARLPVFILIATLLAPAVASGQEFTAIEPREFEGTGLLATEIDPEGNSSEHYYGAGSLLGVELPEGLTRRFLSSQQAALPPAGVATSPENPEVAPASGAAPVGGDVEEGGGSVRAHSFALGGDAKLTELREGTILTTLLRDANGLVTRFVLPSTHRWDMTYDGLGNITSVRDVTFGGTTAVSYHPVHNLPAQKVYPGGAVERIEYDAVGNPINRISPQGRVRSALWNAAGQIVSMTGASGLTTSFTYDAAGNRATASQGQGAGQRLRTLTRDATGRLTRVADPEGYTYSFAYHSSGSIRTFTAADGAVTAVEEDDNGDVTALVLPAGVRHAWTYDGLRRLSSYTQPGQSAIGYDYNVHSDPTAIRVQGERVAEFNYNDRGQMLTSSENAPGLAPLSVTRVFNNTSTGQLTQAESSDGIRMVPTYRGELTRRLTWSLALVGFYDVEIDQGHRITSGQVGTGPRIAYTYDQDNLTLSAGDLVFSRDPATGLVTAATLGVVTEQYQYNGFGELVSQVAQASGTPLFSAQITRDNLGRIIQIIESVRDITTTIAYTYDTGGRVQSVRRNGAVTESYAYDMRGNLISDNLNGNYTYNDADQLLSAGDASFTYTASGERLTRMRAGITQTYRYSAMSTLRGVDLADGRVLRYLHDPAGNRAVRTINGVIQQRFLCPDFNQPVATLNAAGAIAARYVHGLSANTPDYILQDGSSYRIISDHLGSVRFVVHSQTGAIVQQKNYDSYGRTVGDSTPGFQPFGFAGGWTDPDTSLVRFGARDYDPEVRRWTTPDPIYFASGSLNNYSYADGDPVNRVDPSGLATEVGKVVARIDDISGRSWPRIRRNGSSFYATVGTPVMIGDVVVTASHTETSIQFLLGGRANIDSGTTIKIINTKDAQVISQDPDHALQILTGFDEQKRPLKIQTAGGVMGIRG